MTLFAVIVDDGDDMTHVFGPFNDATRASDFRDFATAEFDPARVVILRDPAAELLAWRKAQLEKHNLIG